MVPEDKNLFPRSAIDIKVLHVVPSYFPAVRFGGPIFSTKAIADGVAAKPGFSVKVLTTNSADPNSGLTLQVNEYPVVFPEGYAVWYCKTILGSLFSAQLIFKLLVDIPRSDIVHLTGPYNYTVIPTLILCRVTRTPLVWSPRGGFLATEQWPQVPRKRLKRLFERVCAMILPKRTVFHVTSKAEAEFSTVRIRDVETAIIPNSVPFPCLPSNRSWRQNGKLRLTYLSRIHPKKGLELLIDALTLVPEHVTLNIFGEGDEGYVNALKLRVAELGLGQRVDFLGLVAGEAKSEAFSQCDLFVLPTLSENFGIVIAEALAHGTPVLTTINAPWEELEANRCGLQVEASPHALAKAISALEGMDLQAMGSRGREWMKRDFSPKAMTERFVQLYRQKATPQSPSRTDQQDMKNMGGAGR